MNIENVIKGTNNLENEIRFLKMKWGNSTRLKVGDIKRQLTL